MAVRRKGLGKGLDSMFPSYNTVNTSEENKEETIDPELLEGKTIKRIKPKKEKKAESKAVEEKTTGSENAEETAAVKETVISETLAVSDKIGMDAVEGSVISLKISEVEPNREQPRKEFNPETLEELSGSIRQYGVIQPLVVKKREDYYEIIAGERRWRAAKMAGLKEIPVIIKDYTEAEIMEVSLIENIQRENLNPIEEAQAYQKLLEEFGLTQEELADKVSKNRTTITNALRLLKLDPRVRDMITEGMMTPGHARALLALEDWDRQFEAAQYIAEHKLSVREVEKLVKRLIKAENAEEETEPVRSTAMDLICRDMEDRMKSILGTKININRKSGQKGRIEIEYYSTEELERIYDLLQTIRTE